MSNCKQCNKPIEEHTGRNKRKYCSVDCRTIYLNANKKKDRAMVKLKTHEAVLKENAALKDLVAELRKNNPVLDRGEMSFLKPKKPALNGHSAKVNIMDEVGQTVAIDPDYPVRTSKETPFEFRIRCAEYDEKKQQP